MRLQALTDDELERHVSEWVFKLNESGGKSWILRNTKDSSKNPDALILEMCHRFIHYSNNLEVQNGERN